MRYDVNNIDCIKSDTVKLVERIDKAVNQYYDMNGYQLPDSFKKPDFDKLLKK